MSFWGKLFGTEKALDSIVSGVSNGLDALVYTEEEKATDAALERSEARKSVVSWMNATKGQNLSRRLIALSITATWLGTIITGALVAVVAVYSEDPLKLIEVGKILKGVTEDMTSAVMLILSFYFAAPYMGGIAGAVTKKFSREASPPKKRRPKEESSSREIVLDELEDSPR